MEPWPIVEIKVRDWSLFGAWVAALALALACSSNVVLTPEKSGNPN